MLFVSRRVSFSQQPRARGLQRPSSSDEKTDKAVRGLPDVAQLGSALRGWTPGSLALNATLSARMPTHTLGVLFLCPKQKLWFPSHMVSLNVPVSIR